MPVPAEATPQPGERFLPLPSAPSPLGQLIKDDDDKDVVGIKDDDGNGHLCSMSMHWPSLQVNSPSEQVVSFIRFTCTPSKCQRIEMVMKMKMKIKMSKN